MSEILQQPAYGGEKPARQVIDELREQVERLTKELASAKTKACDAEKAADELMSQHGSMEDAVATAEAELSRAREAMRMSVAFADDAYRHFRMLAKVDPSPTWAAMEDDASKIVRVCNQALAAAAAKENEAVAPPPVEG